MLSGITSNDGLTNVSLKSTTSVNYVIANELMLKSFGLLRPTSAGDDADLIDYNAQGDDLKIDGEHQDFQDVISSLQKEIEELQSETSNSSAISQLFERNFFSANADNSRSTENKLENKLESKLDLLEEIKNLSKEFTVSATANTSTKRAVPSKTATGVSAKAAVGASVSVGTTTNNNSTSTSDAEAEVEDDGLIISDDIKFHNDKSRLLFEKSYNKDVVFINNTDGVISRLKLPAATYIGATTNTNSLDKHLRVVRLGSLNIINQETNPFKDNAIEDQVPIEVDQPEHMAESQTETNNEKLSNPQQQEARQAQQAQQALGTQKPQAANTGTEPVPASATESLQMSISAESDATESQPTSSQVAKEGDTNKGII